MTITPPYIPNELLDIIFSYDGRIKYRKGEFVNVISSNDIRFAIINPIIEKKIHIFTNVIVKDIVRNEFYFEFGFEGQYLTGLCYDFNWSYRDKFEICYYNFKNNNFIQKRVIIDI